MGIWLTGKLGLAWVVHGVGEWHVHGGGGDVMCGGGGISITCQ